MMSAVVSALILLDSLLQADQSSFTAIYFSRGFRCFIRYWAASNYEDAGIWGRRLAEAVSIVILRYHGRSVPAWGMMGDLKDALGPRLQYSSVAYLSESVPAALVHAGDILDSLYHPQTLWECLSYAQSFGNPAAHASPFMVHGPAIADERHFASFIRIVVLYIAFRPAAMQSIRSRL